MSGWLWLLLFGLIMMGFLAVSLSLTPEGVTLVLNWSSMI